jgi:hypothetical protein
MSYDRPESAQPQDRSAQKRRKRLSKLSLLWTKLLAGSRIIERIPNAVVFRVGYLALLELIHSRPAKATICYSFVVTADI